MLCWTGVDDVPSGFGPSVVSVGVFDGVHRGHRHVVGKTVERADAAGATPVVVTFDPHPLAVLRPEVAPPAVSSLGQRLELLAGLLDRHREGAVLVLPFTAELAAEPAESFVERVLVQTLGARIVVVGENFRFGNRAKGDVALLRRMGPEHGFDVEAVPLVAGAGAAWSSTEVRRRLAAGDVQGAGEVLGRPHRLEGSVVPGDRRGRAIGYPTANLDTTDRSAIPADGVYAGWLTWSGTRMPAAISIGTNPTFDGTRRRVEAYVLDRDDLELYGERVAVDFAAWLRDTLRFDSVEALVAQMALDVDRSREITRQAPDTRPSGASNRRDR